MRVRTCAGKLIWGVTSSNECPTGSYRIVDEAQCKDAALTAGKNWHGGYARDNFSPGGCISNGPTLVMFNPHPTGAANDYMQLLCAVDDVGACVCARARARVWAIVCVCV
jgi:hypothetical protein